MKPAFWRVFVFVAYGLLKKRLDESNRDSFHRARTPHSSQEFLTISPPPMAGLGFLEQVFDTPA
jgi:hypothetical protein